MNASSSVSASANATKSRFHLRSSLREFRMVKAVGKALGQSLGLLAVLLGIALLLGVADFVYAFGQGLRLVLFWLLLGVFAVVFLWRVGRAMCVSEQELAAEVDEHAQDGRHHFLSAWELEQRGKSPREFEEFLRQKSLQEGQAQLTQVSAKNFWPKTLVIKSAALLAAAGVLVGLAFWMFPEQSQIHAARILLPNQDRAPWSPLKFVISPERAEVVYGEGLILDVSLSGGKIEELPFARIVTDLGEREMACYQVGEGQYRLSLEGLTENLRLAFASGRARSEWQEVEVLLEPRVLAADLSVRPPSYANREVLSGKLPAEGVVGLVGSEVELVLESNRPLGGGTLELVDEESGEVLEAIEGVVLDEKRVSYTWNLRDSGLVRASLRDIRSTPKTIEFAQVAEPDAVPEVQMSSPPSLILATPKTKLEIEGEAKDDIALERVDFVRSLVGYRDRARNLNRSVGKQEYEFGQPLALEELGVQPGDQLEFYLQATDGNPVLTGMGVSEVSRVVVISEEDYAERLRVQTTMEEFNAKFQELSRLLEEAKESLENLEQAANQDAEAQEQAIQEAQKAMEQAAQMFDAIAKDFPAYDIEESLGEVAQQMKDALEQNAQELGQMSAQMSSGQMGAKQMAQQAQQMQERLGSESEAGASFEQLQEQAKEMAKVGQLMQMSAEFKQIYDTQLSLAKRMNTIREEVRRGNLSNLDQLAKLGQTQQANRERLDAWEKELEKRLQKLAESPEDLSPGLEQMMAEAEQFLQIYRNQGIGPVMDEASSYAEGKNASRAYNQAQMAEALLRQMMNEPGNCMGGMCQGKMPSFVPNLPSMQEMLEAMLKRGQGVGSAPGGSGGGMGGTGGTGLGMVGMSMEVPMLGPDRMRFMDLGGGSGNEGRGGERGIKLSEDNMSQVNPEDTREQEQSKLDLEQVPEAYREAVRRYFTTLDDAQTP